MYDLCSMATVQLSLGQRRGFAIQMAGLLCFCTAGLGQTTACPAIANRPADPAEMAFAQGNMADAEDLFQQALLRQPGDPQLIAGMARTRLRLGKMEEAATAVRSAVQTSPPSAPLQVALAEVHLREGQPWLARESLSRAAEIDPCFAQIWLVRSRLDRLDSMYATERADIDRAYAIDPKNVEIRRTWNRTVTPAKDLVSTEDYLRTTKDVDPELRKAAEETVRTTLQLFSESSQTCKGLPEEMTATLPLAPSRQDGQHIDGYRTEVSFGQIKAMLGVDTAASGLYISRALADANGLAQRTGDPAGTVHADTVQIGVLSFHDCVVGVSDTPFPGKASGFVGTDLFAQDLISLNFPEAKLLLRPLPKMDAILPGDRPQVPELSSYSPVYHRLQYLLVPVTLNNKERRLFVLDSGIRLSAMTLAVAHLVSSTQHGFTNSFQTVSGATIHTYSGKFDMEFAHQQLRGRGGILEFDPATIEQHAGMQIGGMIGFDILQTAVLDLDYRDGLVRVEFPEGGSAVPGWSTLMATSGGSKAEEGAACTSALPAEIPAGATIIASNTGLLDVQQMKAGEAISLKVQQSWETGSCRLERGALLYGHVVGLEKGKSLEHPNVGIAFDRADCFGKGKQQLPLRLVSVVAAPDSFVGLHTAMPTSIGGGLTRNIGDAVSAVDQMGDDLNINPEAQPGSVKTGSVRGLPTVHLEPAGPACSALLTGGGGALRFGVGTRWLLVSSQ